MRSLTRAVKVLSDNPCILLFPAAVSLIWSIVLVSTPILHFLGDIFGNVSRAASAGEFFASLFNNILVLLQIVLSGRMLSLRLLMIAGGILSVVSIFEGAFLSGFICALDAAAGGEKKIISNFGKGVRADFLRVTAQMIIANVFIVLYLIVMVFCSIPLVLLVYSVLLGKPELLFHTVTIGILTVFVIVMGSLFLRVNMFAWVYLGIIRGGGLFSYYSSGNRIDDRTFWRLAVRFLIMDVVSIAYITAIFAFKLSTMKVIPLEGVTFGGVLLFILNWTFSAFYIFFIIALLCDGFEKREEPVLLEPMDDFKINVPDW